MLAMPRLATLDTCWRAGLKAAGWLEHGITARSKGETPWRRGSFHAACCVGVRGVLESLASLIRGL